MNSYFLCSQKVIDFAKPEFVSIPFRSGYSFEKDENYYVAVLDFDVIESYYNSLSDNEQDDFWLQECTEGLMDVSKVRTKFINEHGLLLEIERATGLTTTENRAMVIRNLSEYFGLNPIEFINKYCSNASTNS